MIWVAEIGSNHKGVLEIAHEMIRQAALSGADIAKFQLRDPDDPIRGLAIRNTSQLTSWCEHYGIEFMASVFSAEALDVARSIGMERYKVAYQMKDTPLAREIIGDGKETFVSGITNGASGNVRGISCVSRYPTYPAEVSIPDVFGATPPLYYGYSSHVHGIGDAMIAVSRGAQYIEKHVTLSKTERTIKDNAFSLTFEEFAQMVTVGKEIARFLCTS